MMQNCVVQGLDCEQTYEARVTEVCEDPRANSDPSVVERFTTDKGEECSTRADNPRAVAATWKDPPSPTRLAVSWIEGSPRDCKFSAWRVEAKEVGGGGSGEWEPPEGCKAEDISGAELNIRGSTSCSRPS